MYFAIAIVFFACAACCSFGLELTNRKRAWWPKNVWPEDYVMGSDTPARARQVYLLGAACFSVGFVWLALWASHYEHHLGRLPVLTTLCFFIAFMNASIAVVLVKGAGSTVVSSIGRLRPDDRRVMKPDDKLKW